VLHDPAQLKVAGEGTPVTVGVSSKELTLAGLLLDAADREVRWSDFHDDSADRFAALVAAKVHGQQFSAPPPKKSRRCPSWTP
jgi:hypothetical protein